MLCSSADLEVGDAADSFAVDFGEGWLAVDLLAGDSVEGLLAGESPGLLSAGLAAVALAAAELSSAVLLACGFSGFDLSAAWLAEQLRMPQLNITSN